MRHVAPMTAALAAVMAGITYRRADAVVRCALSDIREDDEHRPSNPTWVTTSEVLVVTLESAGLPEACARRRALSNAAKPCQRALAPSNAPAPAGIDARSSWQCAVIQHAHASPTSTHPPTAQSPHGCAARPVDRATVPAPAGVHWPGNPARSHAAAAPHPGRSTACRSRR